MIPSRGNYVGDHNFFPDQTTTDDHSFPHQVIRKLLNSLVTRNEQLTSCFNTQEVCMPTTTRLRGKLHLNDTAAVHKLPNELLAEVMCTGFYQYNVEDHKHIDYYLSTISSVCAIWRRVALGLPFLWTNIAHDSSTSMHHQHTSSTRYIHRLKRSLDRIETYLARSKNLPLNVVLDFSDEGKVNARRIMKVIIPHTGRFRSWQMTIETKEISKMIFPLRGPLDRLETLILNLNFTNLDNI